MMIDEKYLIMAINIRRKYLKLINNLDLYGARASQISNRLQESVNKIEEISKESSKRDSNTLSEKEILNKLLKIVDDVEEEGKRLDNLMKPMNDDMEKLSKEEIELYRQIVEHHPNLTEDQIVSIVKDRLIKEGLS